MSRDFAWELFKNTGNVDAFMIMRNIENGSNVQKDEDANNLFGGINGDNKN